MVICGGSTAPTGPAGRGATVCHIITGVGVGFSSPRPGRAWHSSARAINSTMVFFIAYTPFRVRETLDPVNHSRFKNRSSRSMASLRFARELA